MCIGVTLSFVALIFELLLKVNDYFIFIFGFQFLLEIELRKINNVLRYRKSLYRDESKGKVDAD